MAIQRLPQIFLVAAALDAIVIYCFVRQDFRIWIYRITGGANLSGCLVSINHRLLCFRKKAQYLGLTSYASCFNSSRSIFTEIQFSSMVGGKPRNPIIGVFIHLEHVQRGRYGNKTI